MILPKIPELRTRILRQITEIIHPKPILTVWFQYYYNAETQKYLYWDAQYSTYMPAPDSTEEGAEGDRPKKDKEDKAKVAKKIQKDMERWAKQQNKAKGQTAVPQGELVCAGGGGGLQSEMFGLRRSTPSEICYKAIIHSHPAKSRCVRR